MTPPRSPAPQRGARLGNKRPAARRRPRAGTSCCEISERRAPAHPHGRRARRATGNTAPAPREGAAPNFEVLEATIDTAHTCFPTGVQPWPFLLRVCLPAYSCPASRACSLSLVNPARVWRIPLALSLRSWCWQAVHPARISEPGFLLLSGTQRHFFCCRERCETDSFAFSPSVP